MANNTQDTFGELRQTFDGSDPFMTGGHQIIKTTGKGRSRGRAPEWTKDEAQFKALLYRAFPKMFSDVKQRQRAGRWARVFYLYYRNNLPSSDVAHQLGITIGHVNIILVKMRRVAKGERANGSGPRGQFKPQGRPRKVRVCIRTS